jgi:hypothetical protein
MNEDLRLAPPRQRAFEFTREGPCLAQGILLECQRLLACLLVEVLRGEIDSREEEES